ncbi:MAG: hypothetical protein C4519_09140 [Desulfobacteraceae bacterium]|nr:MAG: hypothetical protein C4519_09140 [Desulfobacteraceae bacterium]
MSHIPFVIPDEFAAGIAEGSIIRFGTLLKEASSGQVLGHLQETGLGQKLLSGICTVPFSPLESINVTSNIYANIQLTQLKSMIASLGMMQFVNLGAALTGIGVSVVGFSLINQKLTALERHLFDIKDRLDGHFKSMVERETRAHYSRIQTLLNGSQLALSLTNPADVLMSAASRLAEEAGYFNGELIFMLKQNGFDKELFINFTQSMVACNSARLECLLLSNELDAAKANARQMGQEMSYFSHVLEPTILTQKSLGSSWINGGDVTSVTYRAKQQAMVNLVKGLRDATDVAQTKSFLIETLIKNDIDGRSYIQSLQDEKDCPLLILKSEPSNVPSSVPSSVPDSGPSGWRGFWGRIWQSI